MERRGTSAQLPSNAIALSMLHRQSILSLGLVVVTLGCAGTTPPPEQAPQPTPSTLPPAPIEVSKSPEAAKPASPPAESPKPAAATPLFRVTEGVATPESVLYDEVNDRYLVSNINGKPDGSMQVDRHGINR